jgi:lipopolysaccharide transport protein LptA
MKYLFILCSLWLSAMGADAEQEVPQPTDPKPVKEKSIKKKVPLRMSADTSNYDAKTGLITFQDNVVIEDVKFRLECNKMVIHYHKKTKEQKEKGQKAGIEKIVATQGVKIIQPDNQATADRAIYLFDEQTVTLQGSPIVKYKDGRELRSSEIVYDRKNDTIRTRRIQINADSLIDMQPETTP